MRRRFIAAIACFLTILTCNLRAQDLIVTSKETFKLEKEEYEGLSRIELVVGLRFGK